MIRSVVNSIIRPVVRNTIDPDLVIQNWTPQSPLGGETPNLWVKENSRSGLSLVDSVNVANNPTILPAVYINKGGYYAGDKTRTQEHILDGDSYTIFCEISQEVAIPTTSAYEILSIGSNTTAKSKGVYLIVSSNNIRVQIGDNVVTNLAKASGIIDTVNTNFLGLGRLYLLMKIDFTAKIFTTAFYNTGLELVGTEGSIDISTLTFNVGDNLYPLQFKSLYFGISNFKKFNAIKTLAQCIQEDYLTDLQLHYPIIQGFVDVIGGFNLTGGTDTQTVNVGYSNHDSTWMLDYGYDIYTVPKTTIGLVSFIDQVIPHDRNGNSIAFTKANYTLVKSVSGNLTNHNNANSSIRFVQDFFDRSNATIWGNNARGNNKSIIILTGTDGTATLTVNGLAKVATWHTSLTITASDFVTANYSPYKTIGINLSSFGAWLIFKTDEGVYISTAAIDNATLTLNGTVSLSGYYNANDKKAFNILELKQNILYSYLNDGYRGMFYIHCDGNSVDDGNDNCLRTATRGVLQELFLYTTDKVTANHKKVLTYTNDIIAAILNSGNIVYNAQGYVPLGIRKTSSPIMTLRMDDGIDNCYTDWKPLFDTYGIVGCNAILTSLVGTAGFMTWSQILELQVAGWELLDHGYDTADLGDGTPAQCDTAMSTSKADLISHGVNVLNFTPQAYGQDTMFVRLTAAKYFNSCHAGSTVSFPEGNNSPVLDKWDMKTMRGDISGAFMLDPAEGAGGIAAIKAQLDLCVVNNLWSILYFHGHTVGRETGLREVIEYAQSIGIAFVTIQQGLDNRKYL